MYRLALLALLITACAPVAPAYAPPGEILPEQAQRALDAFTATARVMATQAAVATEARRQALEATADAWTATAILQAQQGTQAAATSQARETQTAAVWTQGAVSLTRTTEAGRATATAVEQAGQAQIRATEQARAQRAAERDGWVWFAFWVVVALLVVGGLAAIAWAGVEYMRALARREQAITDGKKAEIAQMLFKQLPGGAWAEFESGRGWVVHQPMQIAASLTGDEIARYERWVEAFVRFVQRGSVSGFSQRAMKQQFGIERKGVWEVFTEIGCQSGILVKEGNESTKLARGQTPNRVQVELATRRIVLNIPTSPLSEPPPLP